MYPIDGARSEVFAEPLRPLPQKPYVVALLPLQLLGRFDEALEAQLESDEMAIRMQSPQLQEKVSRAAPQVHFQRRARGTLLACLGKPLRCGFGEQAVGVIVDPTRVGIDLKGAVGRVGHEPAVLPHRGHNRGTDSSREALDVQMSPVYTLAEGDARGAAEISRVGRTPQGSTWFHGRPHPLRNPADRPAGIARGHSRGLPGAAEERARPSRSG